MRLRYNFDVEKLVQAIAYLSSRGVRDLDKLKILKLLFLADKRHLLEIGRPILGDRYSCMDWGPVASQSYNILRNVIDADPRKRAAENLFAEYFTIERSRDYPALVAKKSPELDVFSDSEIAALDEVIAKYGHLSGTDLIKLTHDDPIWRIPDKTQRKPGSSVEIPFELFFEVNKAEDMLEFARGQQENRSFELALEYEAGR